MTVSTTRFVFVALILGLFYSCAKDDTASKNFTLLLTDCPFEADAINVEIIGIEISGPDLSETIEIDANTGIYNLLDFQDGTTTTLASVQIDVEKIRMIRLILGEQNTIVIDGQEFPLKTPSAHQSGLKLLTNIDIAAGEDLEVTMDFEACKSIVRTGNGKYILKPVIKLLNFHHDDDDNDDDDSDDDSDDDIVYEDLPDAVKSYLEQNLPEDDIITEIEAILLCDGYVVYEIEVENSLNEDYDLYIDAEGSIEVQVDELEPNELMESIKQYLNSNGIASDEIEDSYKVTTPNETILFSVEVEDEQTDVEKVLIFSEEGEFLCEVIL